MFRVYVLHPKKLHLLVTCLVKVYILLTWYQNQPIIVWLHTATKLVYYFYVKLRWVTCMYISYYIKYFKFYQLFYLREVRKESEYIEKLPPGKHSCMGIGRTMPDPTKSLLLEDKLEVPLGNPIPSNINDTSLLYNEYPFFYFTILLNLPSFKITILF